MTTKENNKNPDYTSTTLAQIKQQKREQKESLENTIEEELNTMREELIIL